MTDERMKKEIDRAIERGFENLAYDLDGLASKWELNSEAMKPLIRDWDFEEFYDEWMSEGWE